MTGPPSMGKERSILTPRTLQDLTIREFVQFLTIAFGEAHISQGFWLDIGETPTTMKNHSNAAKAFRL